MSTGDNSLQGGRCVGPCIRARSNRSGQTDTMDTISPSRFDRLGLGTNTAVLLDKMPRVPERISALGKLHSHQETAPIFDVRELIPKLIGAEFHVPFEKRFAGMEI